MAILHYHNFVFKVTKKINWLLRHNFKKLLLATQLQNLLLLTFAILYGKSMRIAHLTRAIPLKTNFHHRQKRLLRFIANTRIQIQPLFNQLLTMILKIQPFRNTIPVIIDQTALPMGYQSLFASVPYHGRALAFAFVIFHYSNIEDSLNQIEKTFFAYINDLLKLYGLKPILILDRGYADVKIISYLKQLRIHYVIRVPNNVYIRLPGYEGNLSGLQQTGKWSSVFYQQQVQELVNLISFWGKDRDGRAELIYLVTDLDPETAQDFYRLRMRIEEAFRDLKSVLGLKELRLKVNIKERLGRLVFGAVLAVVITAYLYPFLQSQFPQVAKRISDLSFVRLVVQVYRTIWYPAIGEFG